MKILKLKNLIAFTLSEMMIVLLIISVISAATIPAISQKRQQEKAAAVAVSEEPSEEPQSTWFGEDFTYGIYSTIASKYYIGTKPTGYVNTSTLTIGSRGNETTATKNKIAFLATNGTQRGRIATDSIGGSIAIGSNNGSYLDASETNNMVYPSYIIGNNALQSNRTSPNESFGNIAIGYAALTGFGNSDSNNPISKTIGIGYFNGSKGEIESIIIGYYATVPYNDAGDAQNITTNTGHIAIGPYAAYYSYLGNINKNSIDIGIESGYYTKNTLNPNIDSGNIINIGYLAGSRNMYAYNVNIGFGAGSGSNDIYGFATQQVNIGYFAGKRISSDDNQNNEGVINIGSKAGYNVSVSSAHSINIGYLAGAKVTGGTNKRNIVIGNEAGATVMGNDNIQIGYLVGANSNIGSNQITIGERAGQYLRGTSDSNVFIGKNAALYSNTKHTIVIGNPRRGLSVEENPSISLDGGAPQYMPSNIEASGIGTYTNGNYNLIMTSTSNIAKYILGGNKAFISPVPKFPADSPSVRECDYASEIPKPTTAYGVTYYYSNFCSYENNPPYAFNTSNIGYGSSASYSQTAIWALSDGAFLNHNTANGFIILYASKIYGPTKNFYRLSDRTLKTDIKPVNAGLYKIRKINIDEFYMKGDITKTKKIGVIAQEVQSVIPNGVLKNPENGYLMVNPEWINSIAVVALQEIDKNVQYLINQFEKLIKDVACLKSRVAIIENRLDKLTASHKLMQDKLNQTDKIITNLERK